MSEKGAGRTSKDQVLGSRGRDQGSGPSLRDEAGLDQGTAGQGEGLRCQRDPDSTSTPTLLRSGAQGYRLSVLTLLGEAAAIPLETQLGETA